ncbi:MAG: vWA domain-containing protein, partial [Treponema sp.]
FKQKKYLLIFSLILIIGTMFAGERKLPVDIFLMIDKSLSMATHDKFDSMCRWIKNEFVTQILSYKDNVFLYSFYENTEKLLSLAINNEKDKQKLINVITAIKPNGKFTDIGNMLDTIKEDIKKIKYDNRYKILILITDLEQDAPCTSIYAGKQESFQSPYLAEARIIKHDEWYEITFDINALDKITSKTKEIYSKIK